MKDYDGPAGPLNTSPFLCFDDVDGLGDIKITIEGMVRVEKNDNIVVEGGRKLEAGTPILILRGTLKRWVLSTRANQRKLRELLGPFVKNWKGKSVLIYGDPDVYFGNVKKGGIRVRGLAGGLTPTPPASSEASANKSAPRSPSKKDLGWDE